jgi:hypothetical protein
VTCLDAPEGTPFETEKDPNPPALEEEAEEEEAAAAAVAEAARRW